MLQTAPHDGRGAWPGSHQLAQRRLGAVGDAEMIHPACVLGKLLFRDDFQRIFDWNIDWLFAAQSSDSAISIIVPIT
jgi:hypothetical protein